MSRHFKIPAARGRFFECAMILSLYAYLPVIAQSQQTHKPTIPSTTSGSTACPGRIENHPENPKLPSLFLPIALCQRKRPLLREAVVKQKLKFFVYGNRFTRMLR
ncbi:MAG: hypothetical protein JWM04_2345 [Verrucomicrobiales bacterium]|nr:hypothetical protein [Verrucomicrobiales bacterium]